MKEQDRNIYKNIVAIKSVVVITETTLSTLITVIGILLRELELYTENTHELEKLISKIEKILEILKGKEVEDEK